MGDYSPFTSHWYHISAFYLCGILESSILPSPQVKRLLLLLCLPRPSPSPSSRLLVLVSQCKVQGGDRKDIPPRDEWSDFCLSLFLSLKTADFTWALGMGGFPDPPHALSSFCSKPIPGSTHLAFENSLKF